MAEVFLGLGSNLGDRREYLRRAVDRVSDRCVVLRVSSLYETEPIGCAGPQRFLNAVSLIETPLSPRELLHFLCGIEADEGRVRHVKNDTRTLDLDILFYGDRIIDADGLTVPHPRLHDRGFVLVPLAEIAPNLVHPLLSTKISVLAGRLRDDQQVLPVEADWWRDLRGLHVRAGGHSPNR